MEQTHNNFEEKKRGGDEEGFFEQILHCLSINLMYADKTFLATVLS